MKTLLVRLKPHDPRRGYVLRRYTYRGIKFHDERGWYRVEKAVADYLRQIRQVAGDDHSPPAFDVCTDDEAKAVDAREKEGAVPRAAATDDIKVSEARGDQPAASAASAAGAVTTADLPQADKPKASSRRTKKG